MTLEDARKLIEQGVSGNPGIWADIGAGTGMFTQALIEILSAFAKASADGGGQPEAGQPLAESGGKGGNGGSRIYAVDKSPHALWALKSTSEVEIIIVEADFNNPLDLPLLDGIVMANALHYAQDHGIVLRHVLNALKPGGTFILVEYDTEIPNPPWVPNPISLNTFESLCLQLALPSPQLMHRIKSRYGDEHIYSAWTQNLH